MGSLEALIGRSVVGADQIRLNQNEESGRLVEVVQKRHCLAFNTAAQTPISSFLADSSSSFLGRDSKHGSLVQQQACLPVAAARRRCKYPTALVLRSSGGPCKVCCKTALLPPPPAAHACQLRRRPPLVSCAH